MPSSRPLGCGVVPAPKSSAKAAYVSNGRDRLRLSSARFSELPGWTKDRHAEALPAFLASCKKLDAMAGKEQVGTGPYGGKARDWRKACRAARKVPAGNHKKARLYFEKYFRAYATRGQSGSWGKITGYYVQPLRAARTRKGLYQFPLYRRPDGLISVSLSDFIDAAEEFWAR